MLPPHNEKVSNIWQKESDILWKTNKENISFIIFFETFFMKTIPSIAINNQTYKCSFLWIRYINKNWRKNYSSAETGLEACLKLINFNFGFYTELFKLSIKQESTFVEVKKWM